MTEQGNEDDQLYFVVRNHEEQYSIWYANREVPAGWEVVGEAEAKESCLDRIEQLWTDMRPLSLRKALGEVADD